MSPQLSYERIEQLRKYVVAAFSDKIASGHPTCTMSQLHAALDVIEWQHQQLQALGLRVSEQAQAFAERD